MLILSPQINTDEEYTVSESEDEEGTSVVNLGYTHDTTTEVYMPQRLPLQQLTLMGASRHA